MSDQYFQLIIAIETTEKAAIDKFYIDTVIRKYYNVGLNKISYVYMSGKHNYKHPKTIKQIDNLVKNFNLVGNKTRKSHIVYVFDKDLNTQDPNDIQFENTVTRYSEELGYPIIWFVRTIEEVMWGVKIGKKEKRDKAEQFISRHQIEKINKTNLLAHDNVNATCMSNILTVLNQFLEKK